MKWSYGVTAVPERIRNGLLERTLASLSVAGFPYPRLFIDGGIREVPDWMRAYDLTERIPSLRTFGNWCLSAWELYLRTPDADRFAIFQDDFVTYRNLRWYLEKCEYPATGYWNLYTFPENEKNESGWYESNQRGKGAVALVFSNEALRVLLSQQYMVDRPMNPNRGWKAVDGGIVSAFRLINWREYVHNPSLVQHTGIESSMGNRRHPAAGTFMGEDFDAMDLLQTPVIMERDPTQRRIGFAGYNCEGFERNWELASNTEIEWWLVKPFPGKPTKEAHPSVDCIFCPMGAEVKLRRFLDNVDVVVFYNDPCYNRLIDMAKARGKRVIALVDTPDVSTQWSNQVDLFLCITVECYHKMKDIYPCVEFTWPPVWHTGANNEFNLVVRTGDHRIAVV